MLTILYLLWSLFRGLKSPLPPSPPPSPPKTPSPKSQSPSPEPEAVSEMSSFVTTSRTPSRYSTFSRETSVEIGVESRASVTSLSSYSTSSRRYEIIGQRSIDSRSSVTSLWSSDTSRRDSETIPEHDDIESSDSRLSFASASSAVSSDGSRRLSEILARRRRSSARTVQVRRYIRRFPLTSDRRRTTGRYK